jgi:hypothetical protein
MPVSAPKPDRFEFFAGPATVSDLSITYDVLTEKCRVECAADGVIALTDIRNGQQRIRADPRFRPTFDQLFDLSGVTDFDVPNDYFQGRMGPSVFGPEARRAFVGPSDYAYGVARMFASWNGGMDKTNIRVFRRLDEAVRWLDEQA